MFYHVTLIIGATRRTAVSTVGVALFIAIVTRYPAGVCVPVGAPVIGFVIVSVVRLVIVSVAGLVLVFVRVSNFLGLVTRAAGAVRAAMG